MDCWKEGVTVRQEGGWGREGEGWAKEQGGKAEAMVAGWPWWFRFGMCRVGWDEVGGIFWKDRLCMCGGTDGKEKDGGPP